MGQKPVIKATYATLKMFPDRQLLAEDVIWIGNDEDGYFVLTPYSYKATHLHEVLMERLLAKN